MTQKIILIAIQYGMLICLIAFIYRCFRTLWSDLHNLKTDAVAIPIPTTSTNDNMVKLVVLESADPKLLNKEIKFSHEISVGRSKDNDIVIEDIYASHHHIIISPYKNRYQIEDLKSRNHTYLNDQILNGKAFLQNGDIIRIGCLVFRFERC